MVVGCWSCVGQLTVCSIVSKSFLPCKKGKYRCKDTFFIPNNPNNRVFFAQQEDF